MQFDIITIFPKMFGSFLDETLIKKAIDKKIVKVNVHDLRKWSVNKHKTVDDKPFGGGPGMILMAEPILSALFDINKKNRKFKKTKVILFSPAGKQFDQKKAKVFSKLDCVIMICGRYEGVDARVEKFIDEKISTGPYVLSGGELPAMTVIEATSRLLPGYMHNPESLNEESFSNNNLEYPHYTRPEVLEIQSKRIIVPKILLSGDHKEVDKWRKNKIKKIK
ncbi:MAG: tRNA (guanosine(37)-N1)-methyltransferase TrmD [Patescibacteria group bacterium]